MVKANRLYNRIESFLPCFGLSALYLGIFCNRWPSPPAWQCWHPSTMVQFEWRSIILLPFSSVDVHTLCLSSTFFTWMNAASFSNYYALFYVLNAWGVSTNHCVIPILSFVKSLGGKWLENIAMYNCTCVHNYSTVVCTQCTYIYKVHNTNKLSSIMGDCRRGRSHE